MYHSIRNTIKIGKPYPFFEDFFKKGFGRINKERGQAEQLFKSVE
jgi:hypothetical protein